MPGGTDNFAGLGGTEGLPAPPPIVAERGMPSPQGIQFGATLVAAPAGEGQGKTVGGVVRDLHAELVAVRAQLALEKAKNSVAAVPGGATSTVAPTGIMTPTPGAGTNLRGQEMEAALTAVNEGLLNSPGFEIGNEVALVIRHGEDTVAQSCTMGKKKAFGLYEIRGYDGKEQLAARNVLLTFNALQQRGSSPRVPSPGGLRVMSAPAPAPGLRREAVPGDSFFVGNTRA